MFRARGAPVRYRTSGEGTPFAFSAGHAKPWSPTDEIGGLPLTAVDSSTASGEGMGACDY
jgi:hypothetical protein